MATIVIQENPFVNSGRIIEEVREEILFIDWLKKAYPKGLPYPYLVKHNNKPVHVRDFDFTLRKDSIVNICNLMKGGLIEVVQETYNTQKRKLDNALEHGRIGDAIEIAMGWDVLSDFLKPPKFPKNTDLPVPLSTKKGSPTYDFTEEGNQARIGQPIPVQYGKMRLYPDHAMQPYTYFIDNVQYMNQLFMVGHGSFLLDVLRIGNVPLDGFEGIEYAIIPPHGEVSLFEDNVDTHRQFKDVDVPFLYNRSIESLGGSPSLATISLVKTAKTVEITSDYFIPNLQNMFEEGDTLVIENVTGYSGEFEVESVDTNSMLTLVDTSAWPGDTTDTSFAVYNKTKLKTYNLSSAYDIYHYGTEQFLCKIGADIPLFELDFKYATGLARNTGTVEEPIYEKQVMDYVLHWAPCDRDGTLVANKKKGTVAKSVTHDTGTTYNVAISDTWVEQTADIRFITDTPMTFYQNGTPIPSSDIVSINYSTKKVTFTTTKSGTLTCNYYVTSHTVSLVTSSSISFGANTTLPYGVTKRLLNTQVFEASGRYAVPEYMYISLDSMGGGEMSRTIASKQNDARVTLKLIRPDIGTYGPYTLLEVKIKADTEYKTLNEKDINMVATRKLPYWTGSAWHDPAATRSIAWALADLYMNHYGGGQPASTLDVAKLLALDTVWAARGDYCDIRYDGASDVWTELENIARLGRAKPVYENGFLTFVREEAKESRVALFSPLNIIKDSFKIAYEFNDPNGPDGVKVMYRDADDDFEEGGYALSNPNATRNEEVSLTGCTNYAQAWREAMFIDAQRKSQNKRISFETEMDGLLLRESDRFGYAHDLFNLGSFGYVTNKTGTTVTLSEEVSFGVGTHYVLFRKIDGSASGPHIVTAGPTAEKVILSSDVTTMDFFTNEADIENTHFFFGTVDSLIKDYVVSSVKQTAFNRVSIEAIPYIESIYTADQGTPASKPDSAAAVDQLVPRVSGLSLSNFPGSGEITATWNPAYYNSGFQVDSYVVESSPDNTTWTEEDDLEEILTLTFSATGLTYVRVRAKIGSDLGPPTSGVIIAT